VIAGDAAADARDEEPELRVSFSVVDEAGNFFADAREAAHGDDGVGIAGAADALAHFGTGMVDGVGGGSGTVMAGFI